jgi:hypothetical protein
MMKWVAAALLLHSEFFLLHFLPGSGSVSPEFAG